MLDSQSALEIIRKYLVQEFDLAVEQIVPEANLFTDLGLDSLDALDMLSMLDKDMNIPIVEDEVQEIRTISHVIDYIQKHASTTN